MKKLFIANWKMNLSHNEACSWLETEFLSLQETVATTEHSLVICPSFTVLPYATSLYPDALWGAQDCGFEPTGAYTGDVSVRSLQDLELAYCLVGHSERRHYYGETDERIAQKTALLLEHGIQPIVCIGETDRERDIKERVLERQIELILPLYSTSLPIFAYEPVWAIGTGRVPSLDELRDAVQAIHRLCEPSGATILYGGSVDETHARDFCNVVDGFLIGSASLKGPLLKKIILSC